MQMFAICRRTDGAVHALLVTMAHVQPLIHQKTPSLSPVL
jgi:hypothetical protein